MAVRCTLTAGIDVPCPECHTLYTLSWLETEATILRGRAGPVLFEAELPEVSDGPRTLGLHVAPSPLASSLFYVICYWGYPVPGDFIFSFEICKDPFSK